MTGSTSRLLIAMTHPFARGHDLVGRGTTKLARGTTKLART